MSVFVEIFRFEICLTCEGASYKQHQD
jgi:hypothetical protein